MARFTPTDIVSQYNALTPLNANFDAIATLLELCVMRDGTSPNSMLANLDMNNWKIQNLSEGTANTDAVTKAQVQDMITNGTIVNLSLSGTLDVSGAGTFDSTLGVAGGLSAGDTLTVAGAGSFLSSFNVTGVSGFTGAVTLASTLGVGGAVTLSSTVDIGGALTGVGATFSGTVTAGDLSTTGNIVASTTGVASAGVTISGATNIGTYNAGTHTFKSASGATTYGSFISSGLNLPVGKYYAIDGNQVLAGRITGWGVPTGTSTRTGFDTSTVTLPELAQAVKALILDLRSHGLIGT